MTTFAVIDATGITAPSYADILAELTASFQSIYGSNVYVAPDSQDGQLLALFASAINDCNNAAVAAYNSISPSKAQGVALSSNVKLNGLRRLISSYSSAVGDVVGVAGTTITNGVVKDQNGNLWSLPASVIIPIGGEISVTVTAQDAGAIIAPAGTIDSISTPSFGWQSFLSSSDATPGAPVETDAALRARQTVSTSLPAETVLGAMLGVLSNLDGVTQVKIYENDTGSTDGNGIPAKSISVVIAGGDVSEIAQVFAQKKAPGARTYGSTTATYVDPTTGISYSIHFYVLATTTIKVVVTGTARTGYTSAYATQIKEAIAAHINALDIGVDVDYSRIWSPAYLNGAVEGLTYEITALTIAIGAGSPGVIDLAVPFNSAAACSSTADVTVTIT